MWQHQSVPRGMMTSARRHHDVTSGSALLTSAVGPSDVNVDRSTGSVGSACQWVPKVSLTLETYKWSPHVRLNQKKKKVRELLGSKHSWAGSVAQLDSAQGGGPAQETAHRLARCGSEQKGRLGYSAQRAGPTGHKRPIATSPPLLLFAGGSWADGAQAAHFLLFSSFLLCLLSSAIQSH